MFLLCWPSSSLRGFTCGTVWDDPVSASSSCPCVAHGVVRGSSQPPAPLGCPAIICPSQGLSRVPSPRVPLPERESCLPQCPYA